MKLKNVQHIIDAYFDALQPLELVRHLETLGYEFEPIEDPMPFPQSKIVADFSEVYDNTVFEGGFFKGILNEVTYTSKILTAQPVLTDCIGNYQYAMAA